MDLRLVKRLSFVLLSVVLQSSVLLETYAAKVKDMKENNNFLKLELE